MGSFSDDLSERLMKFVIAVIKIEKILCRTYSGRHIYVQLFRSATSSGANYEEARAAESRADFVHKMQIVLKELRESHFWIKVIRYGQLISQDNETIVFLFSESIELANIAAKSVVTAKSKISRTISQV